MVCGVAEDALRIKLQAPPVEGKANKALVRFLASALDVPARQVSIVTGETGRLKRVAVRGISMADAARLATSRAP
jgi:uncharacterized protein (TIGR00251 family)